MSLPYTQFIHYQWWKQASHPDQERPFGWHEYVDEMRLKYWTTGADDHVSVAPLRNIFDIRACPYCGVATHTGNEFRRPGTNGEWARGDVLLCRSCRWWVYVFSKNKTYPYDYYRNEVYEAVVHKFDVDGMEVPLSVLRRMVAQNEIDLRSISPDALERLVGAVFRDHLGLEVHHVGGPGDHGVDLLLGQGPKSIAIQVKRRAGSDTAEAAKVVRELIGAVVNQDLVTGVVVSTAARFSSQAATEAELARRSRHHIQIDLYAYDRLREMVNATEPCPRPWEPLMSPFRGDPALDVPSF